MNQNKKFLETYRKKNKNSNIWEYKNCKIRIIKQHK